MTTIVTGECIKSDCHKLVHHVIQFQVVLPLAAQMFGIKPTKRQIGSCSEHEQELMDAFESINKKILSTGWKLEILND